MKLAANDRITLFGLLPVSGDISTIKQLRVLKETLGLDAKESAAVELTSGQRPDGKLETRWNPAKAAELPEKEIEISGVLNALIVGILKDMESAKTLEEKHITLWDKFCA